MRGEHRAGADMINGFVDGLSMLNQIRKASNRGKRGVAFIQVIDSWLKSQRLQRHHSANAKQHLLPQAKLRLALVQTLCQSTVSFFIGFQVGVKQDNLDAPHLHGPNLGADFSCANRHANDGFLIG